MSHFRMQRQEHGQALVEFALVLPLLILLMVGVFDLGWGIYCYTVVSSAAREGARYGTTDLTINSIQNQAVANTVGLNLSPSQVQVTCSYNGSTVTCDPNNQQSGETITVKVPYTFNPITLFFSPFTVTGQSTMTTE
jgi:Flp pilus assembly protein TadG